MIRWCLIRYTSQRNQKQSVFGLSVILEILWGKNTGAGRCVCVCAHAIVLFQETRTRGVASSFHIFSNKLLPDVIRGNMWYFPLLLKVHISSNFLLLCALCYNFYFSSLKAGRTNFLPDSRCSEILLECNFWCDCFCSAFLGGIYLTFFLFLKYVKHIWQAAGICYTRKMSIWMLYCPVAFHNVVLYFYVSDTYSI